MRIGVLGVVAAGAFWSGCATVTFEPKLDPVPNAARKSALAIRTESMVDAIERMPASDAADVRVVLASEPGIEIVEGDVNVKVDPSRYEVLGQVRADYRAHFLADIGFWTYTYREDERWRQAYCVWQLPLSWLTLGIWSIVPIHYPCHVGNGSEDERRVDIVSTLKRATKVLGGNVVAISHFGKVDLSKAGGIFNSPPSGLRFAGAFGVALRSAAPPPPPAEQKPPEVARRVAQRAPMRRSTTFTVSTMIDRSKSTE